MSTDDVGSHSTDSVSNSNSVSDSDSYSVSDSSSEEPVAEETTKYRLFAQLNKVQEAHCVKTSSGGATFGILPAMPGLCVAGQSISLPLMDSDAAAIATLTQHGSKSAFGKGNKTVVDEKVRRSTDFAPTLWELKNPTWQQCVNNLVKDVGRQLINSENVVAEPYKLLWYKPGDHFRGMHRDSAKGKAMFATLIIQLPSACKGGALVVMDGTKIAMTQDFGAADGYAEFGCHYAAHFADVEHYVTPVTQGHRLALVYNVSFATDGKDNSKGSAVADSSSSAALTTLQDTALTSAIAKTLREVKCLDTYAMPLNHQYSVTCLRECGLGALKGFDRVLHAVLKRAGAESKLNIQFAITRMKSYRECSDYDSYDESEYDKTYVQYGNSGKTRHLERFKDLKVLGEDEASDSDASDYGCGEYEPREYNWWRNKACAEEGQRDAHLGNEAQIGFDSYQIFALLMWINDDTKVSVGSKRKFAADLIATDGGAEKKTKTE